MRQVGRELWCWSVSVLNFITDGKQNRLKYCKCAGACNFESVLINSSCYLYLIPQIRPMFVFGKQKYSQFVHNIRTSPNSMNKHWCAQTVMSSNHLISIFHTLLSHVHQAVISGKNNIPLNLISIRFVLEFSNEILYYMLKSILVVLPTARRKKIGFKTQTQWKMPENAIKSTKSD